MLCHVDVNACFPVLLKYISDWHNGEFSDCNILQSYILYIVLQEKYEEATAALAEMEKRAVMAESMLEATLQYQSGQVKLQPSPRYVFKFLKCMILYCMCDHNFLYDWIYYFCSKL